MCPPPDHAHPKSIPLGGLAAPPHLTASAGSLVPARETCLRAQAWLKNSLMSGEMVFTLLKRMGTTWHHLPPGTGHPPGYRTPLPAVPGAYLWEYTFLERSRWTRLVWHPWTRAPKSCRGGDASRVEDNPASAAAPRTAQGWMGDGTGRATGGAKGVCPMLGLPSSSCSTPNPPTRLRQRAQSRSIAGLAAHCPTHALSPQPRASLDGVAAPPSSTARFREGDRGQGLAARTPCVGTHSIQRAVRAGQAEVGERVALAQEALQILQAERAQRLCPGP